MRPSPCFEQGLRLEPDRGSQHHRLGVARAQQGHLEAAIESLQRAAGLGEDTPELAQNLNLLRAGLEAARGDALLRQGRLAEAAACYRGMAQLQGDNAEAQLRLGAALAMANALDEADACLQQSLRIKPDYVEACYELAGVRVRQGRAKRPSPYIAARLRCGPTSSRR